MERSAIVDAYDHRFVIREIRDARIARYGKYRMRSRHRIHVINFAGRRLLAVIASSVPAGDARGPVWLYRRHRRVVLSHYVVWSHRTPGERLAPRHRIGYLIEIGWWIVARSIVEIVAAGTRCRGSRSGGWRERSFGIACD